MTFEVLYKRMQKDKKPPKRMLCLDPGETTGWSLFLNGTKNQEGQVRTILNEGSKLVVDWESLETLVHKTQPTYIVCEDYRIYQHKLDQHTFSSVATLRLIGGIDYTAYKLGIPIAYHMAIEHKGFCDDKKLKMWGYWAIGLKHSRDSIRLGCYHLLFHKGEFDNEEKEG